MDRPVVTPDMNPLKLDPTKTVTQRRRFESDIVKRFRVLQLRIADLVVIQDAFGLRGLTSNAYWEFLTKDQQVQAFANWIRSQLSVLWLGKMHALGQSSDDDWIQSHIEDTHRKAMGRVFDYLRRHKKDLDKPAGFYQGSKEEFLRSSFTNPVSIERVKLLAGRALNELKGISDQMATQMQRTLTTGLIEGQSPWTIARSLRNDVENIGVARSKTIARTEIVRAHNEGQLEGLEQLGVEEVGVAVEWSTSGLGVTGRGYPSPCPLCAPLQGIVLTIKEARGKLPRHPNCMCSWIPAGVGEDGSGQKNTKARILSAVRSSLMAERPKKSKLSLAQMKQKSRWAGAGLKVSSKRPKGIEL